MATTTGTGMYSVAPTVFEKQGPSPHEVLAQQTAEAKKAKAMKAAQDAKNRENALANANATMERLNAENWQTDADYFGNYRNNMTNSWAEVMQRTNGNPAQEDLSRLNSEVANYELESKYSMQTQEEANKFHNDVVLNPDRASKFTPESIQENTDWYALPWEERLKVGKPQLEYIEEVDNWDELLTDDMAKWELADPYAYKSIKGDMVKGATGTKFSEDRFLPLAESIYNMGLVNTATGKAPNEAYKNMIEDISAFPENSRKLAAYNEGPEKEAERKRLVIDHLRDKAMGATPTGRKTATLGFKPGYNPYDEEGNFVPGPKTPGTIEVREKGDDEGKPYEFEDTYNVGVEEGTGDPKSFSVSQWYNQETGKWEKGDLVEIQDGVDIFELKNGKKYMKAKVPITTLGGLKTTKETRLIEITPSVDKKLRQSSKLYRDKMAYEEGAGAAFNPNDYEK